MGDGSEVAAAATGAEETLPATGVFYASLKRNYKQIRDDRAKAIEEDTQLAYRRRIEDLTMELKRKSRERENMLDLSPTSTQSLVMAVADFNAMEFAQKDIELGVAIRNLEIAIDLAKKQYMRLFGAGC